MSSKKLHGELFYPTEEMVNNAIIPDWDALQKRRVMTMKNFGGRGQKNYIGLKSGIKSWMILTSPFTNGSPVEKQTSLIIV